ncbi:chemotaxis protein [Helicobacter sp. MIT 21-1697]|uniref:chemotaxis protein n=1 Tax=Helicobacter sp. MIT 21-1697 TaxID=2993733 RepID=UPI00224AF76A|nr:chemotaxis protein [Helicobacter sp. MIT 21-1697]MCX2716203.1 chemotaxis protein [Helicobacter sp. MIT 21-1697]
MTQEELDSLMNGEPDISEVDGLSDTSDTQEEFKTETIDPNDFRVEADKKWPPPPPTEDHKVVHQLDEVTQDSEVKGTQIFDQLEIMSNSAGKIEKEAKNIKKYLENQEQLFGKLCATFPHIQSFQSALETTKELLKSEKNILNAANDISDASMQAMDLMQYQDIHRQKIERVINVMRALAQYMNSLFEGKIDDSKRVSSAVFIAGDDKEDVANEDDIEALIASFGVK